jgi:hypothetical protein
VCIVSIQLKISIDQEFFEPKNIAGLALVLRWSWSGLALVLVWFEKNITK